MEHELTDEEISHVCMYMRVIDLMRKNQKILDKNEELKKQFEKLCLLVGQLMENFTDEQRDEVLEEHKIQLEELAKKEAKKQRKKQPGKKQKTKAE